MARAGLPPGAGRGRGGPAAHVLAAGGQRRAFHFSKPIVSQRGHARAAHWQMPGHATAKVRRRMKGRAPQAGSCCELKFAEFRAATQADSEKRTGTCAQLEGEYTMSTPPMTRSRCRA